MTNSTISAKLNGGGASELRPIVTAQDHDKLELILKNNRAQWSQPPRALTILLADLFASKPEDPLSWIHAEVWRLDREHSSSRPGTRGQHCQINIDRIIDRISKNASGETTSTDADVCEAGNDAKANMSGELLDTDGDLDLLQSEWSYEAGTRRQTTLSDADVYEVGKSGEVLNTEVEMDLVQSECSYDAAIPQCSIGAIHSVDADVYETGGDLKTVVDIDFIQPELSPENANSECISQDEVPVEWVLSVSGGDERLDHTMNSMPWIQNFKTFTKTPTIGWTSIRSSASRLSISGIYSETKGGIANMSVGSSRCVMGIDAHGKTRFIWNTMFLAALLYELWAVLFELVVLTRDFSADSESRDFREDWFQVATMATLPIFLIDMVFSRLVDEHRNLCQQSRCCCVPYCSHVVFCIDLVSATSHLACIFTEDVIWMRVMLCFRLLRLLHLRRTSRWSMWLQAILTPLSYVFLEFVVGFHMFVLVVSHIDAILWMALRPDHAGSTEDEYAKYSNSFSLIYAALTWGSDPTALVAELAAYGIVIPAQRLSLLILSFVWLAHQTANTLGDTDVAMKSSEVAEYFRARQVSHTVQAMFMERLAEINKVSKRHQHLDNFFAADVPAALRLTVSAELWQHHLSKFSLLRTLAEWHSSFILELAAGVTEDIFASGHVLVNFGDACKNAYLVLSGAFALSEMERSALPDYLPGMWMGEMAFVNPELLHDATLTSKGIVEVMIVRSECFWQVIKQLNVQAMYDRFLQKTVWTGVCGRCGTLGNHFSNSCTTTVIEKKSQIFATGTGSMSLSLSRGSSVPRDVERMDSFQADQLLQFLQDIDLERLNPSLDQHGVKSVSDLTIEIALAVMQEPANAMSQHEKKRFLQAVRKLWDVVEKTTSRILAHSGSSDNHLVFISHFKKEAGTEASLIAQELEHIIKSSPSIPGHTLKYPCFVDSDNLRNLDELEFHVQNSHQLVLLLTPGVLTRPWVLIEIITAFSSGIPIVPVDIQRSDVVFQYPDETYFERVRRGVELDRGAAAFLNEKGFDMEQLEKALRHVFNQIALPFSPHKARGIRTAEINDLLKRCTVRKRLNRTSDRRTFSLDSD